MLGLLNLCILFLCNYTLIPEPSGARSSTDLTVDSLLCADNIVNIPHTPCVKLDIFLVTSVGTHHHLFIGPSLLQYIDFLGQTVHFVVEFVHTKLTMVLFAVSNCPRTDCFPNDHCVWSLPLSQAAGGLQGMLWIIPGFSGELKGNMLS